ncbi:hypothetical protein ASPACDRAFT_46571 [Aspergillus aculeatus ATCC 16872]|uniref:Uncharacterized protein n=1 Tax=Aspergillus aculeatus (strain ATCC 16872 / CBS 172.66 / WB 5094) TaxID=690307 RepID=A0A1L9WJS6_ASPA1|nr:uncharacterized protein ASPACDRAFT_46571 [Aspergillus aculeatus ATCC 16872]OJJ96409.1 hypothetical protein ASPACDRAFT_46571 [Aspergillus aculeatus ATCC 16872]
MSIAANPLAHNPRCPKRSLTTTILQRYNTYPHTLALILNNTSIYSFQMTMQSVLGSGTIGVHGGHPLLDGRGPWLRCVAITGAMGEKGPTITPLRVSKWDKRLHEYGGTGKGQTP